MAGARLPRGYVPEASVYDSALFDSFAYSKQCTSVRTGQIYTLWHGDYCQYTKNEGKIQGKTAVNVHRKWGIWLQNMF